MKSRKNNIKTLKKRIRELSLDLKAISEEYSIYESQDINRLPIDSLHDSITLQNGNIINRITLKSMHHKSGLKKLYGEKKDELEAIQRELNIAKIDAAMEKINEIL
jgi:hypothetical protein